MTTTYKKKNTILVDGSKLTDARIKANKSMQDVADFLGCNKSSVARWEQGRLNPSEIRIKRLVALYGTGNFIVPGQGLVDALMAEGKKINADAEMFRAGK